MAVPILPPSGPLPALAIADEAHLWCLWDPNREDDFHGKSEGYMARLLGVDRITLRQMYGDFLRREGVRTAFEARMRRMHAAMSQRCSPEDSERMLAEVNRLSDQAAGGNMPMLSEGAVARALDILLTALFLGGAIGFGVWAVIVLFSGKPLQAIAFALAAAICAAGVPIGIRIVKRYDE